MGLSLNLNEAVQICIFDLRRGQHEGQELDKILFFFPMEFPFSAQLSVIGLCEGIITFTRIFSPDAACEVIEAERHSYVFYEAEADIWMVLIMEKSKDNESDWRFDALRGILKEVHYLFMMFHGSLRALLEKQPSGELARSRLYPFVIDYLTDFYVGKKLQLPSFRDSLRERGTVQMLSVSREVAIEVQSLVTVLGSLCVGNTTCKSVILFHDLLVSTTLSPEDTTNIYTYAVLRLIPHALSSGTNTWSYLLKGTSATSAAAGFTATTGSVSDGSQQSSSDASSAGQDQRNSVPRPLQREKWFKGKDGFLTTDIWGAEVGSLVSVLPTVWLRETEENMNLCIYQHKNLTIVILIPACSLINEQGLSLAKQQLVENAYHKIINVEEKLSRGWGGENAYHVSGYRYLIVDGDRHISRASPPGKVTTLAKDSLLTLNRVREEIDFEKMRAQRTNPEHEKDFEVCIRAKNNAWVISKVTRGKELHMVLEKANETLLYATETVEKFSNRYCEGAFSSN
ncbi:vacuolar fusion protein CCZ1 homolog [Dioscorea cayenensis subsp. rotundata]|uniref:Vacuolar fusion protein CCZ1 homolog n=1 Tax=Dioscorea cayennensis subsp. rotundata TaxID=55577 RepID=A0AB40BJ04_DIOCR|nr:vacuolar fusion protein CCZ1 homolog [Dioscorea cayenensis subsp. rotundata]